MFYYKLIFIVIAGSIGIWFALQGLVASTDHLPGTFTVDSAAVEQRRQLEAAKGNHSPKINTRVNLTPETDSEHMTVQTQSNHIGAEQASAAEPFSVPEEKPAVDVLANALTEIAEITAIKENRQQTNQQADNSESVAERADSDADMQIDDKNDSDIISSQADNVRGKTPELDINLLDTIKPNDTTKKIKPETVQALDIAYAAPPASTCYTSGEYPQVGVHYRPGSYAIKGKSLTNIDMLVQAYDQCGGKLLVIDNKVDTEESNDNLIQLRQDEVKYYLLQRRVSKVDIIFSDN